MTFEFNNFWLWSKIDHLINKTLLKNTYIKEFVFQKRWETELKLLKGEEVSKSDHKSIIHMSLNRSATQFVKSVLKRVCEQNGMVHVKWNEMAFSSEYPYLDHLDSVDRYSEIFHPKGYLYSAFGGYPKNIPDFEQFKVLLMIRDPRDILVSRYYSKAISHGVPPQKSDKREEFLNERQLAKDTSIDRYVLERSDKLKESYDAYLNGLLKDHNNVYITKFEKMVSDFKNCFEDLMVYIEIDPNDDLRDSIFKEAISKRDKKEDPTAHNRKGKPGDYQEKLSDKTIQKLNQKFSKILSKFSYTLKLD